MDAFWLKLLQLNGKPIEEGAVSMKNLDKTE